MGLTFFHLQVTVVQGFQYNGSHGISVGSLDQYIDEDAIVENVYIYNITMSNASDGARTKNVTYDGLFNTNNDWAIELTQCCGQMNLTLCNEYPSNMAISNVVFKNMWGTSSKAHDLSVGALVCSAPSVRMPL
ncbi:pectin lyase fold/virulence factor [Dactylonectria estremocensis]|uniref:galacturonan 1,4-alpha-galacturonidase n=1 Tax=Dactylonectria estremocensis TaxID=1079267 RepID=A0A9P9IMT3_9HYPO|nr:pectin lyase fold/virulence factor [Dactylonectria estremocensis]